MLIYFYLFSIDDSGNNSSTWAPTIIDARTLAQSMGKTQVYGGTEVSVDKSNTVCFEEEPTLLGKSSFISYSVSGANQDPSEGKSSKSTSAMITKTPSSQNESSNFKSIDIVSAAFADAELDQFDPNDDGNI